MKFSLAPLVLASVAYAATQNSAAAQMEAGLIDGLLGKAECALGCVLTPADKLRCGSGGPASALCHNFGKLEAESSGCISKKCGIDSGLKQTVLGLLKKACSRY
ncbi:hypothetical protein CDD83_1060 [Cordyceps sp. RAO-2017]|nr:hypothetical protein CDD83_1060 [Cordyceps sp. RAO-2017]